MGIMKNIMKNSKSDDVSKIDNPAEQRDKSLHYLQQLAESTIIKANELAEGIKNEAEVEAAQVMEKAEAVQKEAAQVMEKAEVAQKESALMMEKAEAAQKESALMMKKAEAAQKESALMMEKAEEKARKAMSEAQRQADQAVAEANELAEGIKSEAQVEAAKVMEKTEAFQKEAAQVIEKAEVAQKGVNAIIEALRKQILNDIEIIRNNFLPSLDNLSAKIAEVGVPINGDEKTILQVAEELGALSCGPISDIKGNGHSESPEVDNLKSEFATMAAASGQAVDNDIPIDFIDKSVTLPPLPEVSTPFEGEIEIAILAPVDMARLIQFRRNLLDTSHLKVLRTAGSWNEGSVITVAVDKPLPLVGVLMEMPEVQSAELWVDEEGAGGDFPWDLTLELKSGSSPRKRILVTLKKELG